MGQPFGTVQEQPRLVRACSGLFDCFNSAKSNLAKLILTLAITGLYGLTPKGQGVRFKNC